MKNFATSENKFGYIYLPSSVKMAEKEIYHYFLQCNTDEYDALKAEIRALKREVTEDEKDCLGRKNT